MLANGMTHEVPSEFTDEDRWLNIFSTKSFAVLGMTGMVMLFLIKFFTLFHAAVIGWILGGILVVVGTGITMVKKMGDNYLQGAGQTFDRILFLRMVRKRNKVIYVKGYGKER